MLLQASYKDLQLGWFFKNFVYFFETANGKLSLQTKFKLESESSHTVQKL